MDLDYCGFLWGLSRRRNFLTAVATRIRRCIPILIPPRLGDLMRFKGFKLWLENSGCGDDLGDSMATDGVHGVLGSGDEMLGLVTSNICHFYDIVAIV